MNSIILNNTSGVISEPKILNHLQNTLKAKVGDKLKLTVLEKGLCHGILTSLNKDSATFTLGEIKPGKAPWFDLIVGVSRPQTTKKIIEHATTFGVRSITFFNAIKSEKSYLSSKVFDENQIKELLMDGLSQSTCYYQIPHIEICSYHPASRYKTNEECIPKFILDLESSESFLTYFQQGRIDFAHPCLLAIGPERGWVKEDTSPFKSAGFKSVKISSSVLRVEHAIYSAISQLELLRKEF